MRRTIFFAFVMLNVSNAFAGVTHISEQSGGSSSYRAYSISCDGGRWGLVEVKDGDIVCGSSPRVSAMCRPSSQWGIKQAAQYTCQ